MQLSNGVCLKYLLHTVELFGAQSSVLSSMYRLCMRARARGAGQAGAAWAQLCERAARHSEGAAALLALAGGAAPLAALPPPVRAKLMPALAHAAHHHRVTFLQSGEWRMVNISKPRVPLCWDVGHSHFKKYGEILKKILRSMIIRLKISSTLRPTYTHTWTRKNYTMLCVLCGNQASGP